jgi:hypothetical protein
LAEWRNFVCGVMVVILPTALLTQDSGRAMLHNDGGTWLNGNPAPHSAAIFLNDYIQTNSGTAKIDADGSMATIQPVTVVQFESEQLVLDHGSLEVNTARQMSVRVNCVTVIPLKPEWTAYEVTDINGRVKIAAHMDDVKIDATVTTSHSKPGELSETIVHQGEQVTRDERCAGERNPKDGVAADPAFLDTWWAKGPALGAIAVLTCWALCRGSQPVSPSEP